MDMTQPTLQNAPRQPAENLGGLFLSFADRGYTLTIDEDEKKWQYIYLLRNVPACSNSTLPRIICSVEHRGLTPVVFLHMLRRAKLFETYATCLLRPNSLLGCEGRALLPNFEGLPYIHRFIPRPSAKEGDIPRGPLWGIGIVYSHSRAPKIPNFELR